MLPKGKFATQETPRPRGRVTAFGSCGHPRHTILSYMKNCKEDTYGFFNCFLCQHLAPKSIHHRHTDFERLPHQVANYSVFVLTREKVRDQFSVPTAACVHTRTWCFSTACYYYTAAATLPFLRTPSLLLYVSNHYCVWLQPPEKW